jgi:hypothetical protein
MGQPCTGKVCHEQPSAPRGNITLPNEPTRTLYTAPRTQILPAQLGNEIRLLIDGCQPFAGIVKLPTRHDSVPVSMASFRLTLLFPDGRIWRLNPEATYAIDRATFSGTVGELGSPRAKSRRSQRILFARWLNAYGRKPSSFSRFDVIRPLFMSR